jgi:hypothetical protein
MRDAPTPATDVKNLALATSRSRVSDSCIEAESLPPANSEELPAVIVFKDTSSAAINPRKVRSNPAPRRVFDQKINFS